MFKLIKNFKKKDWLLIIVSIALIVMQVWLELKMPDYMSKVTVLVQTEGSKMSEILKNGGFMLLCAFGSLVGAVIVGYLIALLASGFSRNLRSKLFRKVEDMSMSEIKEFSPNSLITRTTNDITQVEMFIGFGLQLLIKAPVTAVWAITKILNKSWEWSMVTAVAVVVLLVVIGILTIIVMPKFKIVQKLTDKLNGVTRENLTGIRVVRAFNAEEYQQEKFQDVNNSLTNLQLFNQKTMSIMAPVMYLVMYMLTLVIYFIGAYLIKDALMADKIGLFGDMVVFSSYAMQIIMSFLMLAMIFMMLPRAQVSANRINEVLDTEISIKDGKINTKTNNEVGTVEFKNVSFKYPDADEYLLKDISFKANKGDTVAFIGSTGSGKSTLIKLILKEEEPTSGNIIINGKDTTFLKPNRIPYLRRSMGVVFQDFRLLPDKTVYENVAFAMYIVKATPRHIRRQVPMVLSLVGLSAKAKMYPNELSGGEQQRVALARALVNNPSMLIADEPTGNLDPDTAWDIMTLLNDINLRGTTVVVATHAKDIVDQMNKRVIHIRKGSIVKDDEKGGYEL